MTPRRTIGHFITNWERSDLPLPARFAVAIRNLTIRTVHADSCCGHAGEPGC